MKTTPFPKLHYTDSSFYMPKAKPLTASGCRPGQREHCVPDQSGALEAQKPSLGYWDVAGGSGSNVDRMIYV